MKPRWTKESNADAEKVINSPGYTLDIGGKCMRQLSKDFILNAYLISNTNSDMIKDINKHAPKYVV